MGRYFVKRILSMIPLLFVISILVFMFIHWIPGDPARIIAGKDAKVGDIELIRQQLGLDKPLLTQYVTWLGDLLHGNFGESFKNHQSVQSLVVPRLPITIYLTICSITWSAIIGIFLGVISAVKRGKPLDLVCMVVAISGISVPSFWLGLELMQLFSVGLGWLPTGGVDDWRGYIMPSLAMGAGIMAILARVTRSSMLENLNKDYIRTARAKGLPEGKVTKHHALRCAMLPVSTVIGLQLGSLLGGALLTETVFAWPGIGKYVVECILKSDFPVVQGVVLLIGVIFVVINLVVDIIYALLDPRIKYTQGEE